MVAKFKLAAVSTFKAKVDIPIPGAKAEPVEFRFNNKTSSQLDAYLTTLAGRPVVDCLQEILAGWDLEDEFTPDNVAKLHELFPACWVAIQTVYLDQVAGVRRKN